MNGLYSATNQKSAQQRILNHKAAQLLHLAKMDVHPHRWMWPGAYLEFSQGTYMQFFRPDQSDQRSGQIETW
jgi:cytochrome c1